MNETFGCWFFFPVALGSREKRSVSQSLCLCLCVCLSLSLCLCLCLSLSLSLSPTDGGRGRRGTDTDGTETVSGPADVCVCANVTCSLSSKLQSTGTNSCPPFTPSQTVLHFIPSSSSPVSPVQVQCCFTRIVRDGEPRTPTSTFTRLLSSEPTRFCWPLTLQSSLPSIYPQVQVQCCFTSTETVRTIRDGEPRTSTSTFTQLPSSETHPH